MKSGSIFLTVTLIAILIASTWLGYIGWTSHSGVQMSSHGYIAMTLGIVFSLIVGCGLMALVFYSSRRGYDEGAQRMREPDDTI